MYNKIIKRLIDVTVSFFSILVLIPLWALVTVAIKIDSPGPTIFMQKRIGKRRVPFFIYKFRTMKINAPRDTPTHLLNNHEQWITRVGRLLRRTSLDELPQIINVLKGEMSIVGPRPALWNQEDLIAERERFGANDIRPGLTGWAQVNGRDRLGISAKARLDGEYAANVSFLFDCKCILMTIRYVLVNADVVEGGTGEKSKDEIKG